MSYLVHHHQEDLFSHNVALAIVKGECHRAHSFLFGA